MSEVKRFFTAIGHEGTPYVDMIEDDSGDYVYYDEYKKIRAQLAEAQGEIGRMNISLELQADRVDKLIDENVKAEADNAELKTEIERRNSKTWCAYCGFEIDIDDEASTKISEHIMSCPKHPIRIYERHSEALEAENAALREQLKKMEEAKEYKDHEFCKDVECGAFDNGRCHARQCCYRTAKHFHRWLKQNGYKIIKSECKKGE
jgi:hypothetical protein